MFTVHLFMIDQAYGGPEEGGWWFLYGEPEDHPANKTFRTKAEAIAYRNGLDSVVTELNTGRRSIESVLSEGEFCFRVSRGYAKPFPEFKPRYE
jgi:hypothetical protein